CSDPSSVNNRARVGWASASRAGLGTSIARQFCKAAVEKPPIDRPPGANPRRQPSRRTAGRRSAAGMPRLAPMSAFANLPLTQIVDAIAARDPTPGAGPTLAWTCALAAALVEMVSAVTLRKEPESPETIEARRDRAHALRAAALTLADEDAAAYGDVLAV